MGKQIFKYFIVTAAVLLLAACGSQSDTNSGSGASEKMAMDSEAALPGLAVEVMEVGAGSLVDSIEAAGIVRGAAEATVVAETEGILADVKFEIGGTVSKGDVLVRFDDSIQRLNADEAQQALETAQLQLSAADRLHGQGGVSQAELLQARSAVKAAEARYAAVKKAFNDRTIRAPISGRIALKDSGVTAGNYLSRGTGVARIVDTSILQLEISVGEREVRLIAPGDSATVTLPACGPSAVEAVVKAVAAGSDPATGSFSVLVEWKNECGEKVRSGMSASVSIAVGGDGSAVLVPASAVRDEGSERAVYVVTGGKAARRAVVTGDRIGNRQQILSGLESGELIIVSGLSSLRENDEVVPTLIGKTGDAG